MAVLRNYTVETMLPLLKHSCYTAGLEPVVTLGAYDNILQEVLDPASHVYADQPDLVLIAWLLEHLDPRCMRSDWDETAVSEKILATLGALVDRSTALVAVQTLLPPLHTESSVTASTNQAHRVARVHALNAAIRRFAGEHAGQVFVVDTERLVRSIGQSQAIDLRSHYLYRVPFKKDFLALFSDAVVRIGRALKGRSKKCLVLDCDNTLWGGVIGEDGVNGIALDAHQYPGRCYYDFQQAVVNLIEQGVIVALCSKNNEADVWEVLDSHPDCLIKRSQLAAWRINWTSKAENIASLAQELNLGLDSFVFVDDSGLECQVVGEALPDVTVLQVPAKIFELPRLVFESGLFDTLTRSREDRQRTAMYAAERQRDDVRQTFASPDEYLASLGLRAVIHEAQEHELSRVAQLVGKTNQFNLTSRRHAEAEVRRLAAADDSAVFSLSASDRFGDLGLVGVLIARRDGASASVDSLLLSCRALGRSLETVFVHRCFDDLERQWSVNAWKAEYIRTKKNVQVERFWDTLGFSPVEAAPAATQYVLPAARRTKPDVNFVSISE
jgi:FkbH-like protein